MCGCAWPSAAVAHRTARRCASSARSSGLPARYSFGPRQEGVSERPRVSDVDG